MNKATNTFDHFDAGITAATGNGSFSSYLDTTHLAPACLARDSRVSGGHYF